MSANDQDTFDTSAQKDDLWNYDEVAIGFLETAVDGIIAIDEKGIIQFINPSALKTFGYASSELIGENITRLMPPEYQKKHQAYIENYLESGKKKIIGIGREVEGMRKDGSFFPIDLAVSEVGTSESKLFVGSIRDLTERKRSEEEREKLIRVAASRERLAIMGELAAGIAHEFRNPLHGVLNCINIFRSNSPDAPDPDMLDLAEEGLRRMDQISGRLLRLARMEDGPKQSTNLKQFLKEAFAFVKARAQKKGVTLHIIAEPDLPAVTMDPERMSEALLNLLNNAMDACRQGEKIVMDAHHAPGAKDFVEICVIDNGEGIPKEIQNRVFDPFFTTKPIGKGSGLGLALVRKIVENHNGSVELLHGQGTTVSVRIPFHPSVAIKKDLKLK